MSKHNTRQSITHEERYQLQQYKQRNQNKTQEECAQWFLHTFGKKISQSTISDSLNPRRTTSIADKRNPARSREGKPKWKEIETPLYEKAMSEQKRGTQITKPLLAQWAAELFPKYYPNEPVPAISIGMMSRFAERNSIETVSIKKKKGTSSSSSSSSNNNNNSSSSPSATNRQENSSRRNIDKSSSLKTTSSGLNNNQKINSNNDNIKKSKLSPPNLSPPSPSSTSSNKRLNNGRHHSSSSGGGGSNNSRRSSSNNTNNHRHTINNKNGYGHNGNNGYSSSSSSSSNNSSNLRNNSNTYGGYSSSNSNSERSSLFSMDPSSVDYNKCGSVSSSASSSIPTPSPMSSIQQQSNQQNYLNSIDSPNSSSSNGNAVTIDLKSPLFPSPYYDQSPQNYYSQSQLPQQNSSPISNNNNTNTTNNNNNQQTPLGQQNSNTNYPPLFSQSNENSIDDPSNSLFLTGFDANFPQYTQSGKANGIGGTSPNGVTAAPTNDSVALKIDSNVYEATTDPFNFQTIMSPDTSAAAAAAAAATSRYVYTSGSSTTTPNFDDRSRDPSSSRSNTFDGISDFNSSANTTTNEVTPSNNIRQESLDPLQLTSPTLTSNSQATVPPGTPSIASPTSATSTTFPEIPNAIYETTTAASEPLSFYQASAPYPLPPHQPGFGYSKMHSSSSSHSHRHPHPRHHKSGSSSNKSTTNSSSSSSNNTTSTTKNESDGSNTIKTEYYSNSTTPGADTSSDYNGYNYSSNDFQYQGSSNPRYPY